MEGWEEPINGEWEHQRRERLALAAAHEKLPFDGRIDDTDRRFIRDALRVLRPRLPEEKPMLNAMFAAAKALPWLVLVPWIGLLTLGFVGSRPTGAVQQCAGAAEIVTWAVLSYVMARAVTKVVEAVERVTSPTRR